MKKIRLIIIWILLMSFIMIPVYANTEESWSKEELDQILETASSLEKAPNINSRHMAIYDRTSRSSYIWKKGK